MIRVTSEADDFGVSSQINRLILKAYEEKIVDRVSVMATGEAAGSGVKAARRLAIPMGVHLNITEGEALGSIEELANGLNDQYGYYCHGFVSLLFLSLSKRVRVQIEAHWRAQIEWLQGRGVVICELSSHHYVHLIPGLFDLTCRLAKEYKIPSVRSADEKLYWVSTESVLFGKRCLNLFKVMVLKVLTYWGRRVLRRYGLRSNDYIIGVGYTGMMSPQTVTAAVKKLKRCLRGRSATVSVVLHAPDLEQRFML